MTHMTRALDVARQLAAAQILGRGRLGAAAAAAAAVVVACSSTAPPTAPTTPPPPPAAEAGPASRDDLGAATIERPRAHWVAVRWSELPGWSDDRVGEFWSAFLRSCERPAPAWLDACAKAREATPIQGDAALRDWLQRQLRPYRIESLEHDPVGLATGYFEPLVEASRVARPGFRIPLHAPPADLATRSPYWTRQQLETLPTAQKSLRGREIAWLHDRLDALVLQVQGSGRLAFVDEHGRTQAVVRVAYAAHNDQPYRSVGRWLIEQGELRAGEASWPAIRAWARQNPQRVDEMLRSNPRVVFFREEPLPDPSLGPKGAQGVPLSPGRSIAIDPQSVPYGTPVWLDTTEPLATRPLRRLVVAQDTGSAIVGAVRADYFWGWGEDAEAAAGRMKQPLRMWALWPLS
ncbi:MAG TPA: MltA domain-containing protein [Caldimonas sp.]|jgi:membrane-bound lytic murein transglycosylase A